MRQPGGEVPKVAGADVVDKETALLVKDDCSYANALLN
jgi:hypothetical protein